MSAAIALDPAPMGHNNPPSLLEILREDNAELVSAVAALANRANAAPKVIATDEDLGAIGDVVKEARKVTKRLDESRKAAKDPHLTAGREIDAFFNGHAERLARVTKALEERATAFQRVKAAEERKRLEEEARRRREEEERQREIAARAAEDNRRAVAAKAEVKAEEAAIEASIAEAKQQASAADLTRTRSESGTVVSARTTWEFEILTLDEVPLEKLRPYLPRADVEKAIRTFVRQGHRDLAGVRIFQKETAAFR